MLEPRNLVEPKTPPSAEAQGTTLAASARVVTLPKGLFLVSVANGRPDIAGEARGLMLPALHVGLAPGGFSHDVEFLPGPEVEGQWLIRSGHLLVVKVKSATAQLLLTSVRGTAGAALDVSIARLDVATPASGKAVASSAPTTSTIADPETPTPKVQIGCHIRGRGDVTYVDTEWAGRVATGAWIEAYSILPLEGLSPDEIEYKGLTSSGFETPWLTGGAACGTRGMAVPLVGFAIRPGAKATHAFDCEYSGFFRSGVVVGPLRNGTPCRSTQAGDPLEGIRFRWVPRADASPESMVAKSAPSKRGGKKAKPGLKFGRYRDTVGDAAPAHIIAVENSSSSKAKRRGTTPALKAEAKPQTKGVPRKKTAARRRPRTSRKG